MLGIYTVVLNNLFIYGYILINDNRVIIKRVALIGNKNDSKSQKYKLTKSSLPNLKKRQTVDSREARSPINMGFGTKVT